MVIPFTLPTVKMVFYVVKECMENKYSELSLDDEFSMLNLFTEYMNTRLTYIVKLFLILASVNGSQLVHRNLLSRSSHS